MATKQKRNPRKAAQKTTVQDIPEASDIPVYCAFDKIVKKNTLKVHPRNPNKHPEHQILLLAKIILKNGWRNPVVVSTRSGLVTKGHGRLLAAQKLEVADVPVDYQDYDSEEMELADVVADNRISELSEMDRPILKDIISDLDTGAFDFDLIGYDPDSLEELMTAAPPAGLGDLNFEGGDGGDGEPGDKNINDAEPQVEIAEELKKKWKTEFGQIWQLGDHRLMCGDSTVVDSILLLTGGSDIDLVFMDPPYGVSIVKKTNEIGGGGLAKTGNYSQIIGDDTTDVAKNSYNACIDIGYDKYIIWGGNYFTDFLPFSASWIIWDKRGDMNGNDFADGEMAWCSFKTPVRIFKQLWSGMIKEGESGKRVHPTQKPYAMLGKIIDKFSNSGDSILELFGGSGSTLLACEKTNRKCIMMELDPKYIAVILERFLVATGTEPKLLN